MTDKKKNPAEVVLNISKIVKQDVVTRGKKVAVKELYFDSSDKLVRCLIFKDMNENRRYDILESMTEYKKGIPTRQTIFKRDQVIKYNPDGSVRNTSKFSED